MRPAQRFAELAEQFKAEICVLKDSRRVNGKRTVDLTTLVAAQGTELLLEAAGPDASAALDALADLIETFAVEENTKETDENTKEDMSQQRAD